MCYFYSSFLSPLANKRTDQYGGSAENRARALRNVVAAVRAGVGPDFPVGIRMSVNDHMPGGQDTDGFAEVAGHIVQAGVDFIALTEGNYESMRDNVPSESGNMLAHGEPQAFRTAVGSSVRLFLSSTPDPRQAAEAIAAGHADATMLARQMLADPDYAVKVIEGRAPEICGATTRTRACAASSSTSRSRATRTRRWAARIRAPRHRRRSRISSCGQRVMPS